MKKPVAIVPTLASTDAPCSALSVIYTAEGETIHNEPFKVTADKVFFAIKVADEIGRRRKK